MIMLTLHLYIVMYSWSTFIICFYNIFEKYMKISYYVNLKIELCTSTLSVEYVYILNATTLYWSNSVV